MTEETTIFLDAKCIETAVAKPHLTWLLIMGMPSWAQ